MNRKTISVSAPGKLMLFGEHAVIYGRPCIVTAVDQRMVVKIERISQRQIIVNAPEVGVKRYSLNLSQLGKVEYPKEVKFVLKATENFFNTYKISSGIKISTRSQFSSLFGFGSSSASTVCVIKGLSEIFDIEVDNKLLFDIAYKTVLDVQGVGSGFDLAAAIWGGTLFFVYGGKKIVPIKTDGLPLVVGYTGIKADTTTLIKRVGKLYKKNKKEVNNIFNSIGSIVKKAKILLERSNFAEPGRLMNDNQKSLVSLGISIKKLDDLILSANKSGAYGSKLSGAGGGDCMIAFVEKKKANDVKKAITKAGGVVIPVKTGAEGVRMEKVFT